MPNIKSDSFHLICLLVDIKHICKFLAFKFNYFIQKKALLYCHKNSETSYFRFGSAVTLHHWQNIIMADGSMHTRDSGGTDYLRLFYSSSMFYNIVSDLELSDIV